jgi:hypothetical protein
LRSQLVEITEFKNAIAMEIKKNCDRRSLG